MLRTNLEQFNFPLSKIIKMRNNSVLTFSKKISISSINTSSNNNTQQKDSNLFYENYKINNVNLKNNNNINS